MKAIIPVAGAGKRLRPHTYTQPKSLILVAGQPILSLILDQLIDAGVTECVFVLGYLGEKIKTYLDTSYSHIHKTYIYQENRRGLGDAILCTSEAIKAEDEVLVLLGDTIVDLDLKHFINQPGSVLATQQVADPRQFGVVEVDRDGRVTKVVEKPSIPITNQAITGLYKFGNTKSLISALATISERAQDEDQEVQLTDAIMLMIDQGLPFSTYEVSYWYDCGKKDVLLNTNRVLLEKRTTDVGTRYIHNQSIIIPPVIFGDACQFTNSIIGPHVTLGDHVQIEGSVISDSIVGNYVNISGSILSKSIIGNDAAVRGPAQSLNIGDNTEIDFADVIS
ncbi:MAG: sugar phosphate nucleotidyltransferase [Bacteroidota bacterium]